MKKFVIWLLILLLISVLVYHSIVTSFGWQKSLSDFQGVKQYFLKIKLNDERSSNMPSSHIQSTTVQKQTLKIIEPNKTSTIPFIEPTTIVLQDDNKRTVSKIISKTKVFEVKNTTNLCSSNSTNLLGSITTSIDFRKLPQTENQTLEQNPDVKEGGYFIPSTCNSLFKIAIIIPYRNRYQHLLYFLQYMHPLLQRKLFEYKIFIINQFGADPFNRAKLINIGFNEAKKEGFNCFIFHDVDMILENDKCPISCDKGPIHLGLYVDKFRYQLSMGTNYMGGVALFSKDDFELINGMSNSYWGWGGEDDDLFYRSHYKNLQINRYEICRYKMVRHGRELNNLPNPKRFSLLKNTVKKKAGYNLDGLSTLNYSVIKRNIHRLYTNITVDVLFKEPSIFPDNSQVNPTTVG